MGHIKAPRPSVLPNPAEFALDAKLARAAAQPPKLPQYRGPPHSINFAYATIIDRALAHSLTHARVAQDLPWRPLCSRLSVSLASFGKRTFCVPLCVCVCACVCDSVHVCVCVSLCVIVRICMYMSVYFCIAHGSLGMLRSDSRRSESPSKKGRTRAQASEPEASLAVAPSDLADMDGLLPLLIIVLLQLLL